MLRKKWNRDIRNGGQFRQPSFFNPARQRGFSLVEILIAGALGLVVSLAAVQMMASVSGVSSKMLKGVKLAEELRTSMQIMTRDIRRAGYTASAMWCLGNTICLPDATIDLPVDASLPLTGSFVMPGGIEINAGNNCFTFELDRNQDGTVTDDEHGAYRRRSSFGVGVLEMWVGSSAPDCAAADNDWVPLTDPLIIHISEFTVDDDGSFDEDVAVDMLGNTTTQRIRRIRLQLEGLLISDPTFTDRLEDTIDVRNDTLL